MVTMVNFKKVCCESFDDLVHAGQSWARLEEGEVGPEPVPGPSLLGSTCFLPLRGVTPLLPGLRGG